MDINFLQYLFRNPYEEIGVNFDSAPSDIAIRSKRTPMSAFPMKETDGGWKSKP
jgi:hypothetical protein